MQLTAWASGDVITAARMNRKQAEVSAAISSNVLTIDLSSGGVFLTTLNANITTITISNPPASTLAFRFETVWTGDGTLRTVTFPASVVHPGDVPPAIESGNGKRMRMVWATEDGGTTWDVSVVGPERGNWTPVLAGDGGASGQTYAVQSGKFWKDGKLVVAEFEVDLTTAGTLTGTNAVITGLPFEVESSMGVALLFFEDLSTAVGMVLTQAVTGGTTAALYRTSSFDVGVLVMPKGHVQNGTRLTGTIIYLAVV